MSPHTPTPWAISPTRAEGEVLIVKTWDPAGIQGPHLMADYRGGHIATLGIGGNPEAQATAEANAAFIITAVNSHDALVAVLERARYIRHELAGNAAAQAWDKWERDSLNALKLAKGA